MEGKNVRIISFIYLIKKPPTKDKNVYNNNQTYDSNGMFMLEC